MNRIEPVHFDTPFIEKQAGTVAKDFWQPWITRLIGVINTGVPRALFDHFADVGNVGTGEDDLYSDSLGKGQLKTNGDKLFFEYSGIFVLHATATRRVRLYFGGSALFDTGALSITATNADWRLCGWIIRESSTVIRALAEMSTSHAALVIKPTYTRVTGLTLANANIQKITGEAAGVGAATNDIVAKLGTIEYVPAA